MEENNKAWNYISAINDIKSDEDIMSWYIGIFTSSFGGTINAGLHDHGVAKIGATQELFEIGMNNIYDSPVYAFVSIIVDQTFHSMDDPVIVKFRIRITIDETDEHDLIIYSDKFQFGRLPYWSSDCYLENTRTEVVNVVRNIFWAVLNYCSALTNISAQN